jgi:hypothetical protein
LQEEGFIFLTKENMHDDDRETSPSTEYNLDKFEEWWNENLKPADEKPTLDTMKDIISRYSRLTVNSDSL